MNVELIDGPDDPEETICRAARNDYMTSYVGDMDFADVMEPVDGDTLEEKQRHLIETTLLKHGHFGPFEHPHFTFAVEGVSRVTMAQLTRHRHVSFDVQSLRYTAPDADEIKRIQRESDFGAMEQFVVVPPTISDAVSDDGVHAKHRYLQSQAGQFMSYALMFDRLKDDGVPPKSAKEDARFLLPMGTKVNIVFTVNARMLMHIGDMRAAGDAQWEIRELTERVLDIAEGELPITMAYYDAEMKGRVNRLAP